MNQDGFETADEACVPYLERVDALAAERFEWTDAPLTPSDFTNSSVYLTYASD